jgi:hypothetical protein
MEEQAWVHNNTFDGCNYGLTIAPGLVALNNIFANSRTRGVERGIYVTDSVDRSIVDHCLFYNNAQHFDSDIRKGARVMIDRDPQLDPDFRLLNGSPCIDAGTARYSWEGAEFTIPETEYEGTAPDLGAKEFGRTDTEPPPGAARLREGKASRGSARLLLLRQPWAVADAEPDISPFSTIQ